MARRIPIIKLRGNLIVSIQIDLSDELVSELKENIAHESRQTDVFGLVIEVSGAAPSMEKVMGSGAAGQVPIDLEE